MENPNFITIKLKSYILNNRKHMKVLTKFILLILSILYLTFRNTVSFQGEALLLFSLIIIAFLSSPRTVIMNESGIKYNLGWKESWNNILSYKVAGTTLIFTTKFNTERKVVNIDADDLPGILKFINIRIQGGKDIFLPEEK